MAAEVTTYSNTDLYFQIHTSSKHSSSFFNKNGQYEIYTTKSAPIVMQLYNFIKKNYYSIDDRHIIRLYLKTCIYTICIEI